MRTRARTALYLTLGVATLVAMLTYVGPGRVGLALQKASPLHLGLAFLTYAFFFVLRAFRWKILLSPVAPDVKLTSTLSITAMGWLANSILPLKGGDVLRAALIARQERVGLATSAATVGLERVLDLVGLAILSATGLFLLPRAAQLPPGLERALALVWILPLVSLIGLAIMVRWRQQVVRLATRLLRPLGKVGQTLTGFGDTVLAGLAALAASPRSLFKLAPLTLAISLSQAMIFAFLVLAFLPVTSPLLALAGSAIFLLSFVVSITPGNVGTYEAAFAAVFIGLGIPAELVVPAAFLTHVTTTLTVAIFGGIGLFIFGAKRAATPAPFAKAPAGGAAR